MTGRTVRQLPKLETFVKLGCNPGAGFLSGKGGGMKRYVVFAALGPFVAGFLLLLVTTILSGYWAHANLSEVAKLFVLFVKSLQFSYLFGILPAMIFAAVDDIVWHIRWISAVMRMLLIGALAFFAAAILYGGRGADSGVTQFILYGLVGLIPTMLCSWLSRSGTTTENIAAQHGNG
jgi:hypothetical protein